MILRRITLPIADFGCAGSGASILERALARAPGVTYAYVNAATEMAYVEFDSERTDLAQLTQVIKQAGFHMGEPLGH